MIRTNYERRRRGVTLVEMLVATAMCIAGMWMLTWMFQQATASFSLANAQVALTSQERMVTQIMTKDLEADRFLDDDTRTNRGRKLSDLRTDLLNDPDPTKRYEPPRAGYFWAQSRTPDFPEPTDTNGFGSSRSVDHFIQFTSILPDTPGNRYYAEVQTASGRKVVAGVAAEISYFLVPAGQTVNGAQLYDLIRNQRVTAQSSYDAADFDTLAVGPGAADAPDEVLTTLGGKMQSLRELTLPVGANSPRFAMPGNALATRTARPPTSRRYGEDRLMSNVLSFEVKFTGPRAVSGTMWPSDPASPNEWPRPFPGNSDYPYDVLPYDGRYDTFSKLVTGWETNPGNVMKPIRITGAMIRIRALQGTTTRQTTLVVSL